MKVCLLGDARSIHVQRISGGLAQRGVSIHVLTHRPCEIPGVSVERYCVPRAGLTNLKRWSVRKSNYLRSFFRSFDVVHPHFLADWGLSDAIVGDGQLAVTPWGSDITPPMGEGTPSEELSAHRRWLLNKAQLVTAWGPWFARAVAALGELPIERVDIVPLGVDTGLFHREAGGARCTAKVGFFKGFRPVYGAPTFVQAMPQILRAVPDARFCMIGDGAEKQACRELAAELGVDERIEWLASQAHDLLPRRMEQWQVSVIPSWQESFGVAALESAAMEIPVVASEVGGLVDTVQPGATGFLTPPGDAKALADRVVTLLRDDALRRRMGECAREWVRREFEWSSILDQWVRLYAQLRERRCVMV